MLHIPGISTIVSWSVKRVFRAYYNPERIKAGISIAPHDARAMITISTNGACELTGVRLQIANQLKVRVSVRYVQARVLLDEVLLRRLNASMDLTVAKRSNEIFDLQMDLQDSAASTIRGIDSGFLYLREAVIGLTVADQDLALPFYAEMNVRVIDAG